MMIEDAHEAPELPPLAHHEIPLMGPNDETKVHRVFGRLIGTFSGMQEEHENHPGDYADAKDHVKCFACRWTEVFIFATGEDPKAKGAYYVLTLGRSDVPGEVDFERFEYVDSAMVILEALTAKQRGSNRLPHAARMAVAAACKYDRDIRSMWMDYIRQPAPR